MGSAVRYHETTLYILNYLTVEAAHLPIEKRLITIAFIEPLNQVWKGISNAKCELLKKKQYKYLINYRLLAHRDYKQGQITFRLETYMKDMRSVEF